MGLASFNNHRRQQGEWASVVDHHGAPPQPSESDSEKMPEELDSPGEERPAGARKSRARSQSSSQKSAKKQTEE